MNPTKEIQAVCQTDGCCATTEDGNAICVVPDKEAQNQPKKAESNWHKLRGGALFVVACITSPCCTPLIIPVILVLLAGTPAAVWISQNLGWVYGGLTLVSLASFVLAWRWMGKRNQQPVSVIRPADISVLSVGGKAHVE